MSISVPVDVHDAFSHLFLVGLASIVEEESPSTYCALRWEGAGTDASIITSTPMSLDDISVCVHKHASKYNKLSAITSFGEYNGKAPRPTMSPRLTGISEPAGWWQLQHDRQTVIDELDSVEEQRYFGALGQPSYWSGKDEQDVSRADCGASRWDMVPRMGGQGLVDGRLQKLSRIVADSSSERIRAGISGEVNKDELDKEKRRRTAAGLHAPALTDNVRAWCAFIGVSAFPVIPSVSASRDFTAAMFEISSRKGSYAVLPVFTGSWTLARFRSVVRSASLLNAGASIAFAESDLNFVLHDDWLVERNVIACAIFRQYVSDTKVKERWLERGTFTRVEGTAQ